MLDCRYSWSTFLTRPYVCLRRYRCVVHPLRCRAIASARLKNDRVDAATLAQLLRADLLPEAWIAPLDVRQQRALVRHRCQLVRLRTRRRNRVHCVLANHGRDRPGGCFTAPGPGLAGGPGPAGRLPPRGRRPPAGGGHAHRTGHGRRDRRHHPLPSARKLAAAAGLTPTVRGSDLTVRYGHISKQGSDWLRWILCEAPCPAGGPMPPTDNRQGRSQTSARPETAHGTSTVTGTAQRLGGQVSSRGSRAWETYWCRSSHAPRWPE